MTSPNAPNSGSSPARPSDSSGARKSIVPVGIDLGTTFSVISHLDSMGRPWSIPNDDGDFTTPSVVLFDKDTIVVGKEAVKAAAMEPDRVAQFVKRDMGTPIYSRTIGGERYPPEVIQSLILEKLKRDAERKIGPIREVVITVPAYFNETRRRATMDAGAMAGLEVIGIINEPTAAAICFGVQQGILSSKAESRQHEKILVYDLGGGTFDVTLMEIDGNKYRTIATAGDVHLGGMDWDRRIVDFVAEEFKKSNHGVDPRENPVSLQRLMREAEEAKRSLSFRDEVAIRFEFAGQGVRATLTKTDFESITADLLERTRFTAMHVMQSAGMDWSSLTRVLLVGGSTRMPAVQRLVQEVSGLTPDRSVSADEAVSHGAALYAGLLIAANESAENFSVQDVSSHDLGVLGIESATGIRRMSVLIPKFTPLPANGMRMFRTHKTNQSSVAIRVVEGGDASGRNSMPIGKCVIRDLPSGLPQGTPVEVEFHYSEDGGLTVRASLPTVGKETAIDIVRDTGLSDNSLQQWSDRIRQVYNPIQLDS